MLLVEALCALLVEVGLLLSWGAVVVLEGEARGAGSGGTVVAAGPGKVSDAGSLIEMTVKKAD